jgi:neutral ceramidase
MKLFVICFCLAIADVAHAASPLMAGVARVDITPTVSMQMYGYQDRECGASNGIHDPLFAKVLVLEAGGSRMAIVTLDLGSIVSERLKDEVASRLKIPVLPLAAAHDHSAPSFLPYGSNPVSDSAATAYQAELERKIFGAVEQASRSMFPARLAAGRGAVQLGYNRLQMTADGRAHVLYRNPERIPYGPVDPEVMLLRVEDSQGRARALLVHYAVHAVVLGKTNCKFSADYPGQMQTIVEGQMPGTQVMFVQGGAGDINPLFLARSGDEAADFATNRKMGEFLAAEVAKANKSLAAVAVDAIRSKSDLIQFRNRWDAKKNLAVGITTVLIGNDIAIATMPGEPMHRLQKMWKSEAGVKYPFFYGYTYSNGGTWAGYIPDLRSASRGGYGADVSTSIEIGAGERLIEQHLINLYGLRGMWHPTPGKP